MSDTRIEKATFAGGCFWCMVKPFDRYEGVLQVISGYTGGHTVNPTYEEVCSETTGHAEAVEITFDPDQISYDTLLNLFWQQIDPTDDGGQFHDRGGSYRPEIFYHTEEQRIAAEASKQKLQESNKFDAPIAVKITPASTFYPAEEYHQDYYMKNPMHYKMYQMGSGRAAFIAKHWGENAL